MDQAAPPLRHLFKGAFRASMRWRSMAASPVVARRSFFSPAGNSHLLHKPLPHSFSLLQWLRECPPNIAGRRISGIAAGHVGIRGSRASVSSISLANSTSLSSSYSRGEPFVVDDSFLSCSMPGRRRKIAVLISGGVDSSVALRLLHAAGHSCTAFYLKIWFQEDFENFWSECPWDEDLKYAQAVCDQIGVPLEVVHLTDEYWNNVVSHIISEYRCGRTPNPDVLCNTRIKFGAFLDAIESMNFDYVASGHYACIVHPSSDDNGPSILKLSNDMVKDQTYFLSHLSQSQLKRLLFPLGNLTKEEVRGLASALNLPNKDRKDSQGICFLGKVKFSEFVAKHIGEKEGVLLEAETGDFLGNHRGFWFYTIGQRQGLRLPGGPWYVVEKDVENNVVFVSRNYFSVDKRRRVFRVGSLKWISTPPQNSRLQCKVRHGPGFYDCTFTVEQSSDSEASATTTSAVAIVCLSEDDQGLAAGQFAVFYHETTCIGSGVILESWDDRGFPICPRALELAKLADKSKLGPPVKIVNQLTSPGSPSTGKNPGHVAVAVSRKMPCVAPRIVLKWRFDSWRQRIGRWLRAF